MALVLDLDAARLEITSPVHVEQDARSALAWMPVRGRAPWMARCDLPSLAPRIEGERFAVESWARDMETARAMVVAQLQAVCAAGDPTVDDLRQALEDLGQSTAGLKAALAARLIAAWEVVTPVEEP